MYVNLKTNEADIINLPVVCKNAGAQYPLVIFRYYRNSLRR